MELEEVRKNSHQQHIESLVMFGDEGLKEINYKLKSFIDSIDDNNNNLNITTKIDGAPAVQIYSRIGNGYPDYGIGLKSLLSSTDNAITTDDEIEAKYSDRPNMAAMLMFCLRLAHSIPAGEIWQGDCLFTSNTKKEVKLNGKNCIIFQPNKVVYSFSEDNPNYEKINSANFGICFHTIYKKNKDSVSQSFKVDPSRLTGVQDDIYIMSPAINYSKSGFDTKVNRQLFNELNELEKKLLGNSYYNELCNNKVFMKYWQMFENHITSDKASTKIDPETFYDDLKQFVEEKIKKEYDNKIDKLKTDKGKANAEENYKTSLSELQYLLEQKKDILIDCVKVFNKVVDIKMNIFSHLKNSSRDYDSYLYKNTGEYEPTSGEGFSMSDQDGNIVKLVDRSEFAHANRSKDYLSGFEHESFDVSNLEHNSDTNTDRDPSVIATKQYHKMKTKKLKPGQMIVSAMGEELDESSQFRLTNKLLSEWICRVLGYGLIKKEWNGEEHNWILGKDGSPIYICGRYFMGNDGRIDFYYSQATEEGPTIRPVSKGKYNEGSTLLILDLSEEWSNKEECFKELDQKYKDKLIKKYNDRLNYYNKYLKDHSLDEGREEQVWFYNKLQDLAQDYRLGRLSRSYAIQDIDGFERRLTDLYRKGKVGKQEANKILRQLKSYRSLVNEGCEVDEEFSSFGDIDD